MRLSNFVLSPVTTLQRSQVSVTRSWPFEFLTVVLGRIPNLGREPLSQLLNSRIGVMPIVPAAQWIETIALE